MIRTVINFGGDKFTMAMQYTFRVGDPVWGKVKGFSAWPGKIILPPDGLKVKNSYIEIFGKSWLRLESSKDIIVQSIYLYIP